jgi:hypothetical protein
LFRAALTRVVGVLRRPGATFAKVAAAPRSAGLLAAMTIAAAATNATFMNTEVGRQALVDQWERTTLAFGQPVDDARYATLQELSEYGPLYGAISAAVNIPGVVLLAAVLLHVVLSRGAPQVPFATLLAVVTHSGVILAVRQIIAAPIAYARETTASATSVGAWFPALDEAAPLARFLGLMDLFVIWWAVVLAIGVSTIYRRNATRLAAVFVGTVAGLGVVFAIAAAVLGGRS